ncbi:MAG: complex I NDUFA9 subunit family protein [Hyphomicrobiales bacterium]|nr:complex I NDUFA9 subunit family protein [Hyphomicrobiales bacterium]
MENNKQGRNNTVKIATVFGGSGFVGRHVVGALAKAGYQIRVAVRRPDLAFHLQPLGTVGQIQTVQANLRFPWSVERAIEGSDVVINLVGILGETGKQKFHNVHCDGARVIAENCKKSNASLVHVSAIGADADSHSVYCSSKGEGEKQVRKALKSAVILRPSIVFGSDDNFFNKFGEIATFSPLLPLIGGGKTRFQPIYVGDVAKAVALAAQGKLEGGKTYEIGGSEILTFRQCMETLLDHTGRNNAFITIPFPVAGLVARLTDWFPGAPITRDQVKMLKTDNVVSQKANRQNLTLASMGIKAKTLTSVLPTYLARFRVHGQFNKLLLPEVEDTNPT